jgi:hypothetical protein
MRHVPSLVIVFLLIYLVFSFNLLSAKRSVVYYLKLSFSIMFLIISAAELALIASDLRSPLILNGEFEIHFYENKLIYPLSAVVIQKKCLKFMSLVDVDRASPERKLDQIVLYLDHKNECLCSHPFKKQFIKIRDLPFDRSVLINYLLTGKIESGGPLFSDNRLISFSFNSN